MWPLYLQYRTGIGALNPLKILEYLSLSILLPASENSLILERLSDWPDLPE